MEFDDLDRRLGDRWPAVGCAGEIAFFRICGGGVCDFRLGDFKNSSRRDCLPIGTAAIELDSFGLLEIMRPGDFAAANILSRNFLFGKCGDLDRLRRLDVSD